jgi:hypothetical protein
MGLGHAPCQFRVVGRRPLWWAFQAGLPRGGQLQRRARGNTISARGRPRRTGRVFRSSKQICRMSRHISFLPYDRTEVPTEGDLPCLYRRYIPRFFLGQQLREHLPVDIVFGFSKMPFEDDQFFAVYEFFHSVLLSKGARVWVW